MLRAWTIGVAVAWCLAGCGPTLYRLDPGAEFVPPSPVLISRTLGIYHSSEFVGATPEARSIGGVLALGEASARLLDALYPNVFSRAVPVRRRPPLPADERGVDAVLEPVIDRFQVSVGPFVANRVLAWADITYRFTVWAPSGEHLTSWAITGRGEAGSSGDGAAADAAATAVERAMRDAGHRFVLGFLDVPEARRWARDLPAAVVTLSESEQTIAQDGPRVAARYPGIVGVESVFETDPRGVLSVRLRVANEGRGRLLVVPDDVALAVGERTMSPMPVSALAVSFTPSLGRTVPAPPFAGVGAAGIRAMAAANLVGALIDLALTIAEHRAFDREMARYRQEATGDARLWEDGTTEFVVHFSSRPVTEPNRILLIPVVDTDGGARYVLRVPVPKEVGER